MNIERNGQVFTLTLEELEAAYRERQRQYRREDAANHLAGYFGIDRELTAEDQPAEHQAFSDALGCSYDEACNESSDDFLLDLLIKEFESERFDANNDENGMWDDIVAAFVTERQASRAAVSRGEIGYDIRLNYGYDGGMHHSFVPEDPDKQVDPKMGEHLAWMLDTTVETEDFRFNSTRIRIPDSVVARIQADWINQKMRDAGNPQRAYEIYKLYWMIEHGFTLEDIMVRLQEIQYGDPEDSDMISTPVTSLYETMQDDAWGLGGGSLWPSFNEFLECEYKEVEKQ